MSEHIAELRAVVERTAPAPDDMGTYLAKVQERAYTVTDTDVEEVLAAGHSQDEIFEQTVAAAIDEGLRRLDAALRVIG
ncbi:MAG TPA: hypothetical protein VGH35_02165 [Gaiellaceae bacterium]